MSQLNRGGGGKSTRRELSSCFLKVNKEDMEVYRPVLPKLSCAHESFGDLIEMQILISRSETGFRILHL